MRATTVPTPTTTFQPGQIALAAGRLLYGSSTGVATSLAAGTNGHVLTLDGGYPTWAAAGGGVASVFGRSGAVTATSGDYTAAQVTGAVAGSASLTTAGAVPYVASSGTLAQDTALNWDSSNNRLGIGAITPAFALDVSGQSTTARIYDQTATTGSTSLIVRAGAGQSGDIFRLQSNGGSDVFSVNATGYAFVYGGLSVVNSSVEKFNFDGTVGVKISSDRDIRFSDAVNIYGNYDVGLDRDAAGVLAVTNGSTGYGRIRLIQATPAASTDACTAGSIWTDTSYIYACTASGTIKRATLNTF
jgi:hypothetical protein